MSFMAELWESVFTPGTTPALIKATHASFILLILSLMSLIFLSRSIHFINLLVISILLYGSVIWFIHELEQAKLKSNEVEQESKEEEQEKEDKEVKEELRMPKEQEPKQAPPKSTTSGTKPLTSPKKRKV